MIEVATQATPVSAADMADALRRVLPDADSQLLISLLSLIWVESGRGQKMRNWNVGNLAATDSYAGSVRRPTWFLITEASPQSDRDLHARMLKNEAPSAFRAYGSLSEGLADFLRLLAQTTRYVPLWAAMKSGDDAAIVQQLHDSGYSKDYGPTHVPMFRALRAEFESLQLFPPSAEPGNWRGVAVVAGAIAIAAGYALMRLGRGRVVDGSKLREVFRAAG